MSLLVLTPSETGLSFLSLGRLWPLHSADQIVLSTPVVSSQWLPRLRPTPAKCSLLSFSLAHTDFLPAPPSPDNQLQRPLAELFSGGLSHAPPSLNTPHPRPDSLCLFSGPSFPLCRSHKYWVSGHPSLACLRGWWL